LWEMKFAKIESDKIINEYVSIQNYRQHIYNSLLASYSQKLL
jgi:hypothetical protein